MSLRVTFDSNGRNRVDFTTLRDHLLATGKTFDPDALVSVPYDQLALCATGEAHAAACSLALVHQEKMDRRLAFLATPQDEFQAMRRYLQAQAMYADVHDARQLRDAPTWGDLDGLQRAWALLICIYNHIDAPRERLRAVVRSLELAGHLGLAPAYTVTNLISALCNLLARYPGNIGSEDFRSLVAYYGEEVIHEMTKEQRSACTRELIVDYHCTSGCFYPLQSTDL